MSYLGYFQFHYGTIKRSSRYGNRKVVDIFQFHYGTIKRQQETRTEKQYPLSIPLWYD